MRKYFYTLTTVIVLLLFCSCSKNDKNSILLLGAESDVKNLNEVYPEEYQEDMKEIIGGDNNYIIPDGICPPNIVGKFHIRGRLRNGNEKYLKLNTSGSYDTLSLASIPSGGTIVNYYKLNDTIHSFDIKVINQNNASAKIEWTIFNKYGDVTSDTIIESAYLRGYQKNENRGEFALYFEFDGCYSGLHYLESFLITGTVYRKTDGNSDHETDGIENVYVWKLTKDYRSPEHIYLVGGSRLYNDRDNFSEAIN